jgi:uncharacterized protein YegP (UPF0339 family)
MSTPRTRYYFETYRDARGEYRWRFWSPNGRKMADSGEGYKNLADCDAAINTLCREATGGISIIRAA